LRVYQLAGPELLTAWIRDAASDWTRELEQGHPAQPIHGARWQPGRDAGWLAQAKLTAYDPWTGQWHSLVAHGTEILLPPFTRSLVVRATTANCEG
jgi:hypothetical protein